MPTALVPWLPRALQQLDLRRRDRLLLLLPGDLDLARAVAQALGPQGSLTILEPRQRPAAAMAAALPSAHVLAIEPGDQRLGSFDTVLAAPFTAPPLPVELWASVVAVNLRPGGRFAIDLPAEAPFPALLQAARDANLPCAARLLANLAGPDTEALAQALRARGLRRVEPQLGTHLLTAESPFDLVDQIAAATQLDDDERDQLATALARRVRTTANVELLAHRSAVAGMR